MMCQSVINFFFHLGEKLVTAVIYRNSITSAESRTFLGIMTTSNVLRVKLYIRTIAVLKSVAAFVTLSLGLPKSPSENAKDK